MIVFRPGDQVATLVLEIVADRARRYDVFTTPAPYIGRETGDPLVLLARCVKGERRAARRHQRRRAFRRVAVRCRALMGRCRGRDAGALAA